MEAVLSDRTVLVIGGTSGIGLGVAELAAREGAALIVASRDAARCKTAAEALRQRGATVRAETLDAADPKGLAAFFERIGTVDHLVSTVGGFMSGGFLAAPLEVIRKAVEEKFFVSLQIARLAAPHVREGGSMVFTAGSGGRAHNACGAIVGNDAIRTLVQGLAVELAPGVRVNAVAPTWTRTPLWRHMPKEQVDAMEQHFARTIPLLRTAKIEEVAEAYLFLMANTFITGQTIAVDGGVTLVP